MKYYLSLLMIASIFPACRNMPEKQLDPPDSKISSVAGSWKGSMHGLRISMSNLSPVIFNEKNFADPANEKMIQSEIHNMSVESKKLNHDPSLLFRDPTVKFLSLNFSQDLKRAEETFQDGKKSFSRYQMMKITSYCVECHTRTEQGSNFSFWKIDPFSSDMSTVNKIEFLIASRKFDSAFSESVSALKKSDRRSQFDLEKISTMGLQVAVQYKASPNDTEEFISVIKNNSTLPNSLREKAGLWKKSVTAWRLEKNKMEPLSLARRLMSKEPTEIEAMRSIHALLPFLTQELNKDQLGESLLLTGRAYESLNESSSLYLHENYYEACIEQAPHTDWARKCYTKLKESAIFGFSGSSGTHIPIDVQIHLEKLKLLSDPELQRQ